MLMKQFASASLFILVLMFSCVFPPSFNSAKAEAAGVYIQADGSIYGTSSIQRNGDVYTFVSNVSGPLYVQRDHIVIDGAGYTLVGGKGRGIILVDRRGVTVKNVCVVLDGGYIIDLENAENCTLMGNSLIGKPQPIPGLPPPKSPLLGPIAVNFLHSKNIIVKDNVMRNFSSALSLEWSSGHIITGNKLVDGFSGIYLWNTTGCVFRNNKMVNSGFSMHVYPLYQYENDLDTSNTIDGKPIYYWMDVRDKKVPSDAAYIVLLRCTNITIENVKPLGIAMISTTNSTVEKVKMTGRGDGIRLLYCSDISIVDSILRDHAIGIAIDNSFDNVIKGNEISNHTTRGIHLSNAYNNIISGNIFAANSYAIAPDVDAASAGNMVTSNNFTKNSIAISVYGDMKIFGNVFEDNSMAILLSGSSGTVITHNTFTNNKNAIYINAASNNEIYLNNFLNNTRQVTDAGVNNTQMSTQPVNRNSVLAGSIKSVATPVSGVNFIPPPPPSVNRWDNGAQGNYWIEYKGSDANGDGIGDTPYYLYENNQDNYPLMNLVAVSEVPSTIIEHSALTPDQPSPPFGDAQNSEDTKPTPDNAKVQEGTVEAKLQIEYFIIAILTLVIGITAILTYLSVKRKGHPPQTKPLEHCK